MRTKVNSQEATNDPIRTKWHDDLNIQYQCGFEPKYLGFG